MSWHSMEFHSKGNVSDHTESERDATLLHFLHNVDTFFWHIFMVSWCTYAKSPDHTVVNHNCHISHTCFKHRLMQGCVHSITTSWCSILFPLTEKSMSFFFFFWWMCWFLPHAQLYLGLRKILKFDHLFTTGAYTTRASSSTSCKKNHTSYIILNVKNAFRRLTEIQCEIIIVMQCLQKNLICYVILL